MMRQIGQIRQIDKKQIDRQIDRKIDRQTDGQTGRQTNRQIRQINKWIGQDRIGQDRTRQDRSKDGQMDKLMDRWTDRSIDRYQHILYRLPSIFPYSPWCCFVSGCDFNPVMCIQTTGFAPSRAGPRCVATDRVSISAAWQHRFNEMYSRVLSTVSSHEVL